MAACFRPGTTQREMASTEHEFSELMTAEDFVELDKLRDIARHGVPDDVRGEVWKYLLGVLPPDKCTSRRREGGGGRGGRGRGGEARGEGGGRGEVSGELGRASGRAKRLVRLRKNSHGPTQIISQRDERGQGQGERVQDVPSRAHGHDNDISSPWGGMCHWTLLYSLNHFPPTFFLL